MQSFLESESYQALKEEAEKLNTGMIVFDVDKTELVHDVSDNVQPLGELTLFPFS